MTQHTATPWTVENKVNITTEAGNLVAFAASEMNVAAKDRSRALGFDKSSEVFANAAHIVKCVNAHDALVAEIKKAVALMQAAGVGYNETGLLSALKLAGEA